MKRIVLTDSEYADLLERAPDEVQQLLTSRAEEYEPPPEQKIRWECRTGPVEHEEGCNKRHDTWRPCSTSSHEAKTEILIQRTNVRIDELRRVLIDALTYCLTFGENDEFPRRLLEDLDRPPAIVGVRKL